MKDMASRDREPSIGSALDDYERREKAAHARYHNDQRFRTIVTSIVALVMREHGPVDPERADGEACDIATKVAALVMETLFTEDRELGEQRALADRYRKLAEDALAFSPPRPFLFSSAKPPVSDKSRDEP